MNQRQVYSIISVLVALIIIISSLAALYYYDYSQVSSLNASNIQQLKTFESKYSSLAGRYNSLLSYYNDSLYYLSLAISQLNTSSTAYIQASQNLTQLWSIYKHLIPASNQLPTTDIKIEFSNGTYQWYNITVQPGWNLYIATLVATNGSLQATWYPEYGEHFVTGILGVQNTNSEYWFLWVYQNASWQIAQVGADDLPANNGTVYAWTFCTANAEFMPTCTP
ncbi:MAG: hypothetical protein QXG05_03975 [Nitrososphaerota archaeon]